MLVVCKLLTSSINKLNFKLKNHSNDEIFEIPKFFVKGSNIIISPVIINFI